MFYFTILGWVKRNDELTEKFKQPQNKKALHDYFNDFTRSAIACPNIKAA